MELFSKEAKSKKLLRKRLAHVRKLIPDEYTKLDFMDGLLDSTDVMMSITSRSDGKTTNMFCMILDLAINCGIKTVIMVPHDFIMRTMLDEFFETIRQYSEYDEELLYFQNRKFAQEVTYDGKTVLAFTNLDDAMELKNNKEFLKQFNVLWFDEFIRLPFDYRKDEIEAFSMILDTMNKNFDDEEQFSKIILTGNPLNFESPFFAEFELFGDLQNHEINTIKDYHKVIEDIDETIEVDIKLEVRRNEKVNKKKSKRIFRDRHSSNTGEFQFNNYRIAPISQLDPVTHTCIKASGSNYLHIYQQNGNIYLSVASFTKKTPDFCTQYIDQTGTTRQLDPKAYDSTKAEKYTRYDNYFFTDAYSKLQYTTDPELKNIVIEKVMQQPKIQESDGYTDELDELIELVSRQQALKIKYESLLDW